jgi:crotonobetainyl-CoA:carnitine CoA-transferase CaiB-like acyl-CoA transferase
MNTLDGIKILDLSRVLAGPWCTQTLADLGADVIKIERPMKDGVGGDITRTWGSPFLQGAQGNDTTEAAYYLGTNRNKRSVACDIATLEGQQAIRDLVMQCDVFVENFKVGDMARYGLDFTNLQKLKPSLVYCSITGFGQTSPYKDRAGYDYAVHGMGGLMSVTGERDDLGGGPQKVGVALADLFTGMYACTAILAAMRHA